MALTLLLRRKFCFIQTPPITAPASGQRRSARRSMQMVRLKSFHVSIWIWRHRVWLARLYPMVAEQPTRFSLVVICPSAVPMAVMTASGGFFYKTTMPFPVFQLSSKPIFHGRHLSPSQSPRHRCERLSRHLGHREVPRSRVLCPRHSSLIVQRRLPQR